jgi:hypothetical protein
MASFSSDFSVSSSFVGAGTSIDATFGQAWPPEAGCIGYSVSGLLGEGVSTVVAAVTDEAREYMARSITDGTSFQITHVAVGSGGYDPANPLLATIVDPTAASLQAEVFRKEVDQVEITTLDGTARSFVMRLGREDIAAPIGEIGLFATILYSPFSYEVGTQFLFAAAHQPLNVKTNRHVASYRVVVALGS